MHPITPPSGKENLIQECTTILKEIEEVFEKISLALISVEDEKIIANVERERSMIREQIKTLDVSVEKIDPYTKIRLEAILPVVEGLLKYVSGEETSKIEDHDTIKSLMLKPSTIMEAKGTLRQLSQSHKDKKLRIETGGAKVPAKLFTDNNFYIFDQSQNEVLIGKKMDQPRVEYFAKDGEVLKSPVITISTKDELQTVLNGHFFDDYAALGIQKRMALLVP